MKKFAAIVLITVAAIAQKFHQREVMREAIETGDPTKALQMLNHEMRRSSYYRR
jgi:hypothetical protein